MKKIILSFLSTATFFISFGLMDVNASTSTSSIVPSRELRLLIASSSQSSLKPTVGTPATTTKKAYKQYYGTQVQQSRSKVTKEVAVTLCNARVSNIKKNLEKGSKKLSDISKVKCMWGTEQIYPVIVSKVAKKGTPQVLGANTSAVSCFDGPRGMRRGNELRVIRRLQSFLIQKGFLDEADLNGTYGEKTIQAVKSYQTSIGLPATGLIQDITREVTQMDWCR